MIEILIAFAVGFWAGKLVHEWIFAAMLRRVMQDLNLSQEDLDKLIEEHTGESFEEVDEQGLTVRDIRIELHNDTLYAFAKDTDEFLGQGATKEALVERLAEKMVNVRLLISKEDGGELIGENINVHNKQRQ